LAQKLTLRRSFGRIFTVRGGPTGRFILPPEGFGREVLLKSFVNPTDLQVRVSVT
jgi:hypothetical protein